MNVKVDFTFNGLGALITIILAILKVTGYIDISWLFVFLPLIISFVLVIVFLIILFIIFKRIK